MKTHFLQLVRPRFFASQSVSKTALFSTASFVALALALALIATSAEVRADDAPIPNGNIAIAPDAEKTSDAPLPQRIKSGADPWVLEFRGRYYWVESNNARREIVVSVADSPNDPGVSRAIWQAPRRGAFSREIWAPELHFVDGKFYVFFAASNGENRNHRSFVLVSETDDPFSNYRLEGRLYTGDADDGKTENRWAIDATLFEFNEKRYFIWSGWERDEDVQFLYIAPAADPPTATVGPRVKICANDDYLWERVEERPETRGLNEGPEILTAPNGRVFLTYSCGASWLPTYKVGLLELVGDDPLDPQSWRKFSKPFFESDERQFGVGHGSFVRDENGTLHYVYHAKTARTSGWNRAVFSRPVDFDADGFPVLR